MVLRRPAGGIDEVAIGHAQTLGLGVHQVGEGVFAAGNMLGQGNTGVVTGLNDDAAQQVNDRHLVTHANEHLGATHAPGLLADQHRVVLGNLAALDLLTDDVAGHHLGQAGRRQRVIGIVLDQNCAAVGVDQQVAGGRQIRRRRHDRRSR